MHVAVLDPVSKRGARPQRGGQTLERWPGLWGGFGGCPLARTNLSSRDPKADLSLVPPCCLPPFPPVQRGRALGAGEALGISLPLLVPRAGPFRCGPSADLLHGTLSLSLEVELVSRVSCLCSSCGPE